MPHVSAVDVDLLGLGPKARAAPRQKSQTIQVIKAKGASSRGCRPGKTVANNSVWAKSQRGREIKPGAIDSRSQPPDRQLAQRTPLVHIASKT